MLIDIEVSLPWDHIQVFENNQNYFVGQAPKNVQQFLSYLIE